jgi:hypothetical protein
VLHIRKPLRIRRYWANGFIVQLGNPSQGYPLASEGGFHRPEHMSQRWTAIEDNKSGFDKPFGRRNGPLGCKHLKFKQLP